MGTQVSGSQISRTWQLLNSLGLIIIGGATTVSLFSGRNGAGRTTFKDLSDGTREQSGSLLIASGSVAFRVDANNRRVGIRTLNPRTELEVNGTMSGNALWVSSFSGAGLTDCDATNSKLLWDITTQRYSCSIDQTGISFSTGNVLTINGSYLKKGGDTSTGVLVINITGGNQATVGLKIINTASGAHLHGEKTLSTSGTLVFEGAASGSSLYLGSQLNGAGLSACTGGNKLLWSGGRFSCSTDIDTNTTYTAAKGLTLAGTVFSLNDTITGTLLKINGTMSGKQLVVSQLRNCDSIDATSTGALVCGTDATAAGNPYTAGQGLQLLSTSFRLASTISGTLLKFQTVSGSTIFGTASLRSSGALVWDAAGSGQSLTLAGSNVSVSKSGSTIFNALTKSVDFIVKGLTDSALFFLDASTDRVGIGTATPRTKLEVKGTASASLLTSATVSGSQLRFAFAKSPTPITWLLSSTGSAVTTGSGKIRYPIDKTMSGFRLGDIYLSVAKAGVSGTTCINIRNAGKGYRKLLSTPVCIDSTESGSNTAATPFVIDTSKNEIGTYDNLFIDVTGVSTTAPRGATITTYWYRP